MRSEKARIEAELRAEKEKNKIEKGNDVNIQKAITLTEQKPGTSGETDGFDCETCGKRYTCMGSLRRHLDVKHNDVPDLYCNLCDAKFKHLDNLRQHYTKAHKITKNTGIKDLMKNK